MKKILSAVILFSFSMYLVTSEEKIDIYKYYRYSKNELFPDEAREILLGNVDLAENGVSDFSLAMLGNKDLRFLRNAIYAKHGHTFESKDLTYYFSKFAWYKPNGKVTDADLTETEKKLIERIRLFETRDETIDNLNLNNNQIGCWQDMAVVAAGYSNRYIFYDNKKTDFLFSQMSLLPIAKEYNGEYKIKGNVLIFSVNSIVFIDAHPDYEGWKSKSCLEEWGENSRINTMNFAAPLIFKFPVTAIYTEKVYDGLIRNVIKIGSVEYFKYSADVNHKY